MCMLIPLDAGLVSKATFLHAPQRQHFAVLDSPRLAPHMRQQTCCHMCELDGLLKFKTYFVVNPGNANELSRLLYPYPRIAPNNIEEQSV